MAACGVAGKHDPFEVDGMMVRQRSKMIGPASHILEGAGPAATDVANSTVFQRPDGQSPGGKIGSRPGHVADIVVGQPAAAVQKDDHGERSVARRQPEFAELLRGIAIKEDMVRRWPRRLSDGRPGNRSFYPRRGAGGQEPQQHQRAQAPYGS